jgi:hypothetical protein
MHKKNWNTFISANIMPMAVFTLAAVLFCGCTQTGKTSNQASISANPAMYHYNPGSRDFETRWPFGPANYH